MTEGDFMLNSTQQNEDGRSTFSFQGHVELTGRDLTLVRYDLGLDKATKDGQASQQIHFGRSVLVGLNDQVVIAKSKDHEFRLKISIVK